MTDQRLFDLTPIEQIRKEMQQQERHRELHPDLRELDPEDRRLLSRIWVAYVWTNLACDYDPSAGETWEDRCVEVELPEERWVLWGFRRKPQRLTWRSIKRIRRKLHVPRGATLQLVELWQAHRDGPPVSPPARHVRSTAPDVIADEHVAIVKHRRSRTRKFRRPVLAGFGRNVQYVALAIPLTAQLTKKGKKQKVKPDAPIKRLFLGPLMSDDADDARGEAVALWGGYYGSKVEVYEISNFKKSVRRRMRNGRVRPGITRLDLGKAFEAPTAVEEN